MTQRVTIRIPADLHHWLIVKAGTETARVGQRISMNTLITSILQRAQKDDKRKALSLSYD